METLLILLGGTPARYAFLALVAGAFLVWAAWDVHRVRRSVFLFALGIALLACRWPLAAHNVELGVDDSQAIAAAMRLSEDPIPWKYADINTVGPLNVLPLVVASWLGFPINFLMSHFFALAMIWMALAGAYLVLAERGDERVARFGVLPPAAFFALTIFFDFSYSTSEHVSLALIGVGSALLWQGAWRGSAWRVFAGALALGATPWAKLQSVPLALWFCAAGVAVIVWRWRGERRQLRPLLAAWLGGGVAVSAGFGLMLAIWGLVNQWWVAYIRQAVDYADRGRFTYAQFWTEALAFGGAESGLRAFAGSMLVSGLMLVGATLFVARRRLVMLAVAAGALALASYVIAAPGRQFYHYFLFGVIPLAMLVAALLDAALERAEACRPRWFPNAVLAGFLLLTLVPQIRARIGHDAKAIPYQRGNVELHRSDAARYLAAAARPGDTMSVWGWVPRLHVESGLPPATRDGTTERQIIDHSLRQFYRQRYLFDLRRSRPRFFVEAISPGFFAFTNRATMGVQTWPELQAYLDDNYALAAEIDGFRIFQARETASDQPAE